MVSNFIACAIIDDILEQEEEEQALKKFKRKKRKWSIQEEAYSNKNLWKILKESEPKQNYMGITDEVFDDLLSKVSIYIQREDTPMRKAISARNRLAITLRFLATGCSYEELKLSTSVSAQSIGTLVIETCEAIVKVLKSFIKLPKTPTEWMDVVEKFYEISMFPNCLGSLSGKHINIMKPPQTGSSYYNYKKTFSIVVMALVNSESNFLMVDVGTSGRMSDVDVFSNKKFIEKLENLQQNLPQPKPVLTGQVPLPYVFVSDAAFTLNQNILKSFDHVNLTNDEILYNKTLSSAQARADNAFGILASRFGVLRTTINLSPEKASVVVLACCYLHNYLQHSTRSYFEEFESIVELSGMDPSVNKNLTKEAQEIRLKFCEAIKKLEAL